MLERLIHPRIKNYLSHRTTEAYIIGFPKTGTTWLRVMLGKYVQLLRKDPPNGSLPLFSEFDGYGRCIRWHPQIPAMQFTHGNLHWEHQTAADLTFENTVAPWAAKTVVLQVRNLPDALVSMYWQRKTMVSPPYPGEIGDFLRDPVMGVEKAIAWHRHWFEARDRVHRLLLVRYEDLRNTPKEEFTRFLNFLNIPVIDPPLEEAVAFSGFENMRKMEQENQTKKNLVYQSSGLPIFATGDTSATEEAYHIRKGQISGFLEYVQGADLDYLREKLKALPDWFGYPGGILE